MLHWGGKEIFKKAKCNLEVRTKCNGNIWNRPLFRIYRDGFLKEVASLQISKGIRR